MCGIAGIVSASTPINGDTVVRMRDCLTHRGPDDAGLYVSSDGRVALGNRRLAIIDPEPQGRQPLCNEDETVWVTYNGEIYNFRSLREELKEAGHRFRSSTDTEVLIHGYEAWGMPGLLARLRGMFAFALCDTRRTSHPPDAPPLLFLARDRLGIKPLYYTTTDDPVCLIFASEVRAVLASGLIDGETDTNALIGLLLLGAVPAPQTIHRRIRSLPAGHVLTVTGSSITSQVYWDLASVRAYNSDESAATDIRALGACLEETARQHLISDAPLGVFLSGGIDSAGLVALAGRANGPSLTTLTIAFDEQAFNEAESAQRLAEHYRTKHHEIRVTGADFYRSMPSILEAMDQPTNDGVNTYFVAQAAHQLGLKVVLSGVGGDELFWGYPHHRRLTASNRWWSWFFQRSDALQRLLTFFTSTYGRIRGQERWMRTGFLSGQSGVAGLYLLFRGFFAPDQVLQLLNIDQSDLDTVIHDCLEQLPCTESATSDYPATINRIEMQRYLHDQLLRDTDVFGMAHSVEVRVPYLDHEVVEKAMRMPSALKIDPALKKPLLVRAIDDPVIYETARQPKRGFSFPMASWMRRYADPLEAMALEADILDRKTVKRLWQDFRSDRLHWSRAWMLVVLGGKKWS